MHCIYEVNDYLLSFKSKLLFFQNPYKLTLQREYCYLTTVGLSEPRGRSERAFTSSRYCSKL